MAHPVAQDRVIQGVIESARLLGWKRPGGDEDEKEREESGKQNGHDRRVVVPVKIATGLTGARQGRQKPA